MAIRRRFIAKFGKAVTIDDAHPLAIAQDALDAGQPATGSGAGADSGEAAAQDGAIPRRRGRKPKAKDEPETAA